jgi:hypothetical protein
MFMPDCSTKGELTKAESNGNVHGMNENRIFGPTGKLVNHGPATIKKVADMDEASKLRLFRDFGDERQAVVDLMLKGFPEGDEIVGVKRDGLEKLIRSAFNTGLLAKKLADDEE